MLALGLSSKNMFKDSKEYKSTQLLNNNNSVHPVLSKEGFSGKCNQFPIKITTREELQRNGVSHSVIDMKEEL